MDEPININEYIETYLNETFINNTTDDSSTELNHELSKIQTDSYRHFLDYEVKNIIQNSFDDAILMGCDEGDFKKKVRVLIDELKFSIGK